MTDYQNANAGDTVETADVNLAEMIYRSSKWATRYIWLLIVLVVVGTAAGIYGTTITYKPLYTSSAFFSVTVEINGETDYDYNTTAAASIANTLPYILTSEPLRNIVVAELGETEAGIGIDDIVIEAESLGKTPLLTIRVTSPDAEYSYKTLVLMLEHYPSLAEYVLGKTQLKMIIEPSVAKAPDAEPRYSLGILLGVLAGAAVFAAVIALFVTSDTIIVTASEIEEGLGKRCLGIIPYVKREDKHNNAPVVVLRRIPQNGFSDSISRLRNDVIKYTSRSNYKTILITSTTEKEGKSTIAANLAITLARRGYKTVIVDCDMRNPAVLRYLHLSSRKDGIKFGLEDVLVGKASLDDTIFKHPDLKLWVLPSLQPAGEPAELAASPKIAELIRELRAHFDYVIIDTPPAETVADASVIAKNCDALLYVIRQDTVSRKRIKDTLATFSESGINLIGCALTMTGSRFVIGYNRSYGYGYGYGYGYRKGGYGYSDKENALQGSDEPSGTNGTDNIKTHKTQQTIKA